MSHVLHIPPSITIGQETDFVTDANPAMFAFWSNTTADSASPRVVNQGTWQRKGKKKRWKFMRDPLESISKKRYDEDMFPSEQTGAPKGYRTVSRSFSHKMKYSNLHLLVNTNRAIGDNTAVDVMKAQALVDALQDSLRGMLSEMQQHGRWINTWQMDSIGTRTEGVSWGPNVKRAWGTFKIEVGPNNGYIHAHIFLGIQHKMMIAVRIQEFQAELQRRMNQLKRDNPIKYSFGDDLDHLYAAAKFIYKNMTIEEAYAQFKEYVEKQNRDAREYYEEMQRHLRNQAATALRQAVQQQAPPGQVSIASAQNTTVVPPPVQIPPPPLIPGLTPMQRVFIEGEPEEDELASTAPVMSSNITDRVSAQPRARAAALAKFITKRKDKY